MYLCSMLLESFQTKRNEDFIRDSRADEVIEYLIFCTKSLFQGIFTNKALYEFSNSYPYHSDYLAILI